MWTERKKCGWKDMQEQTEMDNRTGKIQKENTEMDRKKNVDKNGQEKTEIWTERQTWKKGKDGREKQMWIKEMKKRKEWKGKESEMDRKRQKCA